MSEPLITDIVVAGNGPIGMAAAIALADVGFKVAIAGPQPRRPDQRTTALMMPSIHMLQSLGVWDHLSATAAPLRAMRIVDGTSRLVRSRPVTFRASEVGEDAFGYNLQNLALNAALAGRLEQHRDVTVISASVTAYENTGSDMIATVENGDRIVARLVVAGDGRGSLAREHAAIKVQSWSYPQTAFVTTFEHRLPHDDMSTEFHTETGPFTQVPLFGNRSSLVWVVKPEEAAALKEMAAPALSAAIEERMQSFLGKVTVGDERQTYALSGQYPLRFAQNRVALVGEAAHVFPPIGAQGLNLGLRDVEDLRAAVLAGPVDVGADQVMAAYDRARRPDVTARTGAVDALNRTLLSSFLPAQFARATGLALLELAPPLRSLFMREGMRPGSGIGTLLGSVREKIGRNLPFGDKIQEN